MRADAVVRTEPAEHLVGDGGVQVRLPRVVLGGVLVGNRLQVALVARLAAPVVDELVAGHADQPRRGELGTVPFCTADTAARNVSAVRSSATVAPSQRRTQVAVHLRERPVVQREQGRTLIWRCRDVAHW